MPNRLKYRMPLFAIGQLLGHHMTCHMKTFSLLTAQIENRAVQNEKILAHFSFVVFVHFWLVLFRNCVQLCSFIDSSFILF